MSLIRLLPPWLHAVADYAVGTVLILAALIVGGTSGAVGTGVVVGATGAGIAVLAVSLITNYQYAPRNAAASATGDRNRVASAA